MALLPRTTIILPVHNRRDTTVDCLRALASDGLQEKVRIIVVDDGSTDGSAEAVAAAWPGATVLRGDGDLWWTGAMRLGMEAVQPDCEVIIWLNDDCRPRPGTIDRIAAFAAREQSIAVAQSITEKGYIYGGMNRSWNGFKPIHPTIGENVSVDTFGGNCVAFPRPIVERLGSLDAATLPHFYADADYGLRARKAGVPAYAVGDAWCDNDHNVSAPFARWTETDLSFREIQATMKSPKSWLYWPARRTFYVRHWGLWGSVLAIDPYLRFYAMWTISTMIGRDGLRKIRDIVRRPSPSK